MSSRRTRLIAIVSAGLLALTGCTGESGNESTGSSSTPAELDSFYDQEPVWGGCQSGPGECAGVEVPVDYEEPDGLTLMLNVRRIPARGDSEGTLFFNPGGPGASGVQILPWWRRELSAKVQKRFDLVSFDTRGTAGSEGLRCVSSGTRQGFRTPDRTPDSKAEEQKLVGWYRQIGRACIERAPDLTKNMSSADIARDLEVLRGVFGDDRMNYVGVSYGTVIGAHYADLFPDRVGRVVLDSAVDTTRTRSELVESDVRAHRMVLRAYLRDCVRQGCPLGSTAQQAKAKLQQFLSSLDAKPLVVDGHAKLTENHARDAIEYALSSGDWPSLTKALRGALQGNAGALYKLAVGQYGVDPSRGPLSLEGRVTECSDRGGRLDVDAIRELAADSRRVSPVFGQYFAWAQVPCGQWPVEAPSEPADLDGAGADPIVVTGSRGDPITPYENSAAVAERLESAVLLTERTYAHGTYPGTSRCIDARVDAYLVEGEVPDDGHEC